jgi:acyl-CoA synthetase (AMP-forming)/AMP-acid ligase II
MADSSERVEQIIGEKSETRLGHLAVAGQDGESLTYRELFDQARTVAARLQRCGVKPGDAVIIAVSNQIGDLPAQLGAWLSGAVAVPVHRSSPKALTREIAIRSAARALVGELSRGWPGDAEVSGQEGNVYGLCPVTATLPAELGPDQALVIFTSGTTGRPKGVVLSHQALCGKLRAINSVLAFEPGTSLLQVLHLHFSFGQWTSLLTLATGGTIHLVPKFSVPGFTEALAERAIDRTAVVPTMLRKLLAEADDHTVVQLRAAAAPRLWISGGEPLTAALGRRVAALLPHSAMTDVFGLSETCTSDFIVPPASYDELAGSIGFPSPGVIARVAGADGQEAPAGEVGELWIKTPYRMTGYLGDVAATAGASVGEWFRSGDLASRAADGRFVLAGRAKNLISRGGVKVSPLEIETVYGEHPSCAAALATGVPDEILGERIVLLVTLRRDKSTDGKALRAWGSERMDRFKVPDEVRIIDELPLGPTGKLDRVGAERIASQRDAQSASR